MVLPEENNMITFSYHHAYMLLLLEIKLRDKLLDIICDIHPSSILLGWVVQGRESSTEKCWSIIYLQIQRVSSFQVYSTIISSSCIEYELSDVLHMNRCSNGMEDYTIWVCAILHECSVSRKRDCTLQTVYSPTINSSAGAKYTVVLNDKRRVFCYYCTLSVLCDGCCTYCEVGECCSLRSECSAVLKSYKEENTSLAISGLMSWFTVSYIYLAT